MKSASNISRLNDEAFNFMMQFDEDDSGRKLDVFKDEDGKWYVDMMQFKDSKGLHVVSRRYGEIDDFI